MDYATRFVSHLKSYFDSVPANVWYDFETNLHPDRTVECPTHGVKSAIVPWAEPHNRFTMLFERFAIDVLQMTQTVKGAMSILRLKWDATWHIIERAVVRGKAWKEPSILPKIGIDEKAFAKGQSYVSMIYDLENSTVESIQEGRDTEVAVACFSQLSEEQIKSVGQGARMSPNGNC